MKVCYINNLYKPYAVGGAEQAVEELAKEGDVVISWKPWAGFGSWKPERIIERGVIIYRFWVPNIFSYKNLVKHNFILKLLWHKIDIFNFWSAQIIKKILLAEKPEAVNTHNLTGIGFGVPRLVQKMEIRHIHTLHDVQLVEPSGVLLWDHEKDSLAQKVYSWIMKWRLGRPDEIVFLSDFLKKFYLSRGFFISCHCEEAAKRLTKQSLGISNIDNAMGSPRRRSAPPRDDRRERFLFVGSLVKHKGIGVLMKAWEALPKDFKCELHIVGSGVLRDIIEEWAKKDGRVKIHGRLEKEELNKVYKNADALIFPSICIENRPKVLIEAMECGLDIIASDAGGVGEILSDYGKARLVEPGNAEKLTNTILDFRF